MRLGIVADTHDNVTAIEACVATFAAQDVATVIHCGDFIAPPVIGYFDGAPLHGVLGNNDGERDGLEAAFRDLDPGSELHGRFADLIFDDARIAVLHGEDKEEVIGLAEAGTYDYVLYGHHHETDHREIGDTTVVNPGAHFPTVPDEHRRVAIIETGREAVRFLDPRD